MKKFKIIALLLAMAFILVSCGDTEGATPASDEIGGNGEMGTDEVGEPEPERIRHNVPDADFGGHRFTILVSVNGELVMMNDFEAEELMGEPINDAIYIRNSIVEEKFNIEIANVQMPLSDWINRPETRTRLSNSIMAGDHAYDAVMISGHGAASLAQDGLLMDMGDLAPIDLSMPWWDQMANRDLRIMDRMFFTTGALSNVVNRATYAVLFKKQLIQDFGLENPYDLVRAGEWTYDKLIEMATVVTQDLDGDGVIGINDRVGALVWDDTIMGVVNSIGERSTVVNTGGELEIVFYNERTLQAFNTFIDFTLTDAGLMYQRIDWTGVTSDAMFAEGRALFYMQIMELVTRLRAMEMDFGVLPSPKLDTNQRYYHSTVGGWHSGFICIPIGQQDAERTASIIEVMAAESVDTLQRAYYEVALVGQLIRDYESEEMLDIIFGTRVFDVGWLFQIGNFDGAIMDQIRTGRREFASLYERNRARAERDVERINNRFAELFN